MSQSEIASKPVAPGPGDLPPTSLAKAPANLRLWLAAGYVLLLAAAFFRPLSTLVTHALGNDLHSHIVLIPFISGYLLAIGWRELPEAGRPAFVPAGLLVLAGGGLLFEAQRLAASLSLNDYLALMAGVFLCLLWAGSFLLLGWRWMKAAAFPVFFLIFLVPMPDGMAAALETASKVASAGAAEMFFNFGGVPFLREGLFFKLPGILIEVAQECSGIRSSWVLFITSLLAAHLFLRSNWRRTLLVVFVIPLGIIRNGFRIGVIGWLCAEYGPQMIDSVIHRRGGPVFFVLSLVPLFLFLWWLRWMEQRGAAKAASKPPA